MFAFSPKSVVGIGGKAWIVLSKTNRKISITDFSNQTVLRDCPIVSAATAVDLPDDTTVIVRVNEATDLGENANTLLSVMQMRNAGVTVHDVAKRHGGLQSIVVDDYILPLNVEEAMLTLKIRRPTETELETCEIVDLTDDSYEWDPKAINDPQIGEEEYKGMTEANDTKDFNMRLKKSHKLLYDWKKYEKFLLNQSQDVVTMTLENTTQLGKVTGRFPMRKHLKSRNPLLNTARFSEPYASDTWFASETSYEGYNCVQVFWGTKSKML